MDGAMLLDILTAQNQDARDELDRLRNELDRLRAMEAAIREDCWSDRDPHGTFERYLNTKATT